MLCPHSICSSTVLSELFSRAELLGVMSPISGTDVLTLPKFWEQEPLKGNNPFERENIPFLLAIPKVKQFLHIENTSILYEPIVHRSNLLLYLVKLRIYQRHMRIYMYQANMVLSSFQLQTYQHQTTGACHLKALGHTSNWQNLWSYKLNL